MIPDYKTESHLPVSNKVQIPSAFQTSSMQKLMFLF